MDSCESGSRVGVPKTDTMASLTIKTPAPSKTLSKTLTLKLEVVKKYEAELTYDEFVELVMKQEEDEDDVMFKAKCVICWTRLVNDAGQAGIVELDQEEEHEEEELTAEDLVNWGDGADQLREACPPDKDEEWFLENIPRLRQMAEAHPWEMRVALDGLVCCGCDRPMEGEKDFGNNADVADTCCEECFNKHLAEQDE